MIAEDFYYNGHYLSDFGLMMATPESDDTISLTRELLKGETNPHRPAANHYGAKYSEAAQLNFFIIRQQPNDYVMPWQLNRDVQAWLTSSTVPLPLILEHEFIGPVEFLGVFTEIEPFVFWGLEGYNLVFTCNAPFAYKPQAAKFTATSSGLDRPIMCDTDENNFVYPTLKLTNFSGGTFSVINGSDSAKEMSFTLNSSYSEYVIDCQLRRILADGAVLTLSDAGWNTENISDYNNVNTGIYKAYWLRLLPGLNNLTFTGVADCFLEFKAPIKIGGFIDVQL